MISFSIFIISARIHLTMIYNDESSFILYLKISTDESYFILYPNNF